MDMFSQFFVSPLMLKEAMQREREAIESGESLIQFGIQTYTDM
jgi:secreted Zn-dependent insulinase-like peptidase